MALLWCIAVAALAGGCRGQVPQPVAPATLAPYTGNVDPPLLVDVGWLQARMAADGAPVVVLDASSLANYRAGHVPGAVHAWWQDTMDPNGHVYGTVLKPDLNAPDPQLLRRHWIEDIGVRPSDDVVVYDDVNGRWAARIVWTLRFLGYPRAAVLEGGLAAWRGAGGIVEEREHAPRPVDNPRIDPQRGWYLVTSELLPLLNDPAVVVVDVRTPDERADDVDGTIASGSIPGSVALSWTDLYVPGSGRLKSESELRALFEATGITPDQTVVLYARFGTETALSWLALNLLDYPTVMIYDGGWVDWSQDPSTPKQSLGAIET